MSHLTRLRDWPERLDALLRDRAATPFGWGTHDCCTFVADALQAITGVDVMGDIRQSYSTAFQALGLTQQLGGLKSAVTGLLGEPCSPALVTVGDVLLLRNDGREVLALCNGSTALAPGPVQGLAVVSDLDVIAAWRVA